MSRSLRGYEQVVRRGVAHLFGWRAVVAGHQLGGRRHGDVPAEAVETFADVFALLEVPQLVVARHLPLRSALAITARIRSLRSRRLARTSGSAKSGSEGSRWWPDWCQRSPRAARTERRGRGGLSCAP